MPRVHLESRGNVENLTNEGSDGFKMVLNCYRLMETTRLGYLVVSCKNGPWKNVVEDPMKLEHDRLEKTKGPNLVFLMKTYYWPPWLNEQKHCSNIFDLGAVEVKILQSALVEQQTAILFGPTLSKEDLVLAIDYVSDLQSNMADGAVRAEPMKLEHDKLEKTKGLNLVFVMRTYYWPPWLNDQKTMMTMSLTCRAIWQMALWEQLLHRPSLLLVITRLNHICSL